MAGLVPAIHAKQEEATPWMPGSRPGMTQAARPDAISPLPPSPNIDCSFGSTERFVPTTSSSSSPATTTRPSASSIRASTKPGRCGSAPALEDRPRYTPTTTFETFPFPEGLTPNIPAADYAGDPRAQRIAAAAKRLDELRRAWLNPPDLVDIAPEITPTAAPGEAPRRYPDRILPKNAEAAVKLKARTLTNLYNERPRWLADAHDALDRAVAAAYGWPEDIATDDALARLLALNLERARAREG